MRCIKRLLREVETEDSTRTGIVFCFVFWDILSVRAFSSPVFSYLFNAHCSSLFIWQVNVLDCSLYTVLAMQPRTCWQSSLMLSALIADSCYHSDPLLFCSPACCTFSCRFYHCAAAAHLDLLTDKSSKRFSGNQPIIWFKLFLST